jgi:hypothetical protein
MATTNFGKAFRAAREAGKKEFEFGGKKYSTKMKDEDLEKSERTAEQRKKGETLTSLMSAERNMPSGTSDLAKQKIKEAVGNAQRNYAGNPTKGVNAIDKGGTSRSLKVLEDRDKDTERANIKAAQDYNRGRKMESDILNNMITNPPMKKGGMIKKMASGGMTASSRADGCAVKGKTKGRMV